MKDKVCLNISRGKSWIHIIYNGEIIGKIEVSEANRGNQCNLAFYSDKEVTRYKIERSSQAIESDDNRFNREEYNR